MGKERSAHWQASVMALCGNLMDSDPVHESESPMEDADSHRSIKHLIVPNFDRYTVSDSSAVGQPTVLPLSASRTEVDGV